MLSAWVHWPILAKFGQIRDIKVSMDSGKHADHVWAHNLNQMNNRMCMHALFFHPQIHILAKLGQIRDIKVSMEPGEHAGRL